MQRSGTATTSRRVLVAVVLVVLAGLLVASVISVSRVRQTNRAIHEFTNHQVPAYSMLLNCDRDLYQAQLAVERYVRAADPQAREIELVEYQTNVAQVAERFGLFRDRASAMGRSSDASESFLRAFDDWQMQSMRLLWQADANPADASFQETLIVTQGAFTEARNLLDVLEEQHLEPILAASGAKLARSRQFTAFAGLMITSLILIALISIYVIRSLSRQHEALEQSHVRQAAAHDMKVFESRVSSALSMAQSEPQALRLMIDALREASMPGQVDILLADSSQSHLYLAASSDVDAHEPHCPVKTPHSCPAVNCGHELTFPSSQRFDACPYLRRQEDDACSCVCIPITISGRTVGVMHSTGPVNHDYSPDLMQQLSTVTSRLSERVSLIRAYEQSQSQAASDPLTGLLNRRSIEHRIKAINLAAEHYALVFSDLDHFKQLNDVHGHETGDRALRLFSRVLSDTVRPNDIVGRWGGEEFLLVLPRTDCLRAARVTRRIQEQLARGLQSGEMPVFTASFGIAHSTQAAEFSDVLALADTALLEAKAQGRDRTIVAGQPDRPIDAAEDAEAESPLDELFHGEFPGTQPQPQPADS